MEADRMAAVYGGAFVTIAAVASSDFHGGCFLKAGNGDFCRRVRREDKGLDVVIGLRTHPAISKSLLDIGMDFPMLSLAWVYQERMLSRRLLYCTRTELQLICREAKVCECGGSSVIHTIEAAKMYPMPRRKQEYAQHIVARMNPERGRFQDMEAAIHWHRIVSDYSKLQLTYASDKLPALSGCARDIANLTDNGGEYLAGLWRHTLDRDLLSGRSTVKLIRSGRRSGGRHPGLGLVLMWLVVSHSSKYQSRLICITSRGK
ncbi:hypothetical protein jhhlp_000519 [Lomentospora prolificans]|uniref:Heterokaryon incompatibility domain-containing protein n=1 Tax=Lomentospora prolificans TaxID=41688 RepID=A0A2N3NL45_9PEZI|nr:hypothetical protein jhhlp_000519 [Lomentospora prolificans]